MPVLRRTDAASILNLPVVTQPQTTYYSTMMYPTYHIIHYRAVICRTQFYDHISDTADQVNDDCHLILLEEWVYTELRAKAVPDHQDMESNQKKKKKMLIIKLERTALTKTTQQSSPRPLFPPSLPDDVLSWAPNTIYIPRSSSFTPFLLTFFHPLSVNLQLHRGPTRSTSVHYHVIFLISNSKSGGDNSRNCTFFVLINTQKKNLCAYVYIHTPIICNKDNYLK